MVVLRGQAVSDGPSETVLSRGQALSDGTFERSGGTLEQCRPVVVRPRCLLGYFGQKF